MISQTSEESIAPAPPGAETDAKQTGLRSRKVPAKHFSFFWKRDSRERSPKKEDVIEVKILECKLKNAPSNKMSFDFFRDIKKHMQFRNLTVCKSKHKIQQIEASSHSNDAGHNPQTAHIEKTIMSAPQTSTEELQRNNVATTSDIPSERVEDSDTCQASSSHEHSSQDPYKVLEDYSEERNIENIDAQTHDKAEVDQHLDAVPVESQIVTNGAAQESQYSAAAEYNADEHPMESDRATTAARPSISDAVTNDNRVKASLAEELLKLSKHGWYWGPISGDEADAKLISEPDGAFLVRDSSDDRYVLTLSFKSSGRLLHARMEHSGGLFSLCNHCENEGFTSVAALINHSMNFSQSAVFCYSRPKFPGYPSFPVRLTKPVSRFTQVRSLQYLCRFVIRQNTRLDNIHKLPLPNTIKGYIEEAHY